MTSAVRTTSGIVFFILFTLCVAAQVNVTTWHYDNLRTGANNNETVLTPANVNPNSFGKLFTQPVDGFIVGQPLYLSNVLINGSSTHNVVYVGTLHDTVYAFDADTIGAKSAPNGPLWSVNLATMFGETSVPISQEGCVESTGFPEMGIVSTPVIDPAGGTLYVVAKTMQPNGTQLYRLHALDVTSGAEKFGGPVVITASLTVNGHTITFVPKIQMQRPALLISNGILYLTFGSNGCSSPATGWIMAYDPTFLTQLAVFSDSVSSGNAGIWMSGAGPAADANGNIYFSTADGTFDASIGGTEYGDSVVKLTYGSNSFTVTDYFTPFNQAQLNTGNRDLGSGGVMLLPDQSGQYPHLASTGGKGQVAYLLNRDNLGQFNSVADQVLYETPPTLIGAQIFSTPVYWNGNIYYAAGRMFSFALSNGSSLTLNSSSSPWGSLHTPWLTANGNTGGILWVVNATNTSTLLAYDANNMASKIYDSTKAAGGRDAVGPTTHFAIGTTANGKVYLGTQSNLSVYGLLPALVIQGGNNQSGTVLTQLPIPLQVQTLDSYTGAISPGVAVTFSDGGKGGTFSSSSVVTDSNGNASTFYTLPSKAGTFTITASTPNFGPGVFTEIATPGAPFTMSKVSGNAQTAQVGTTLPVALVVKITDHNGNGISGLSVSYSDKGKGGTFSPPTAVTNSTGNATASYTAPIRPATVSIVVTSGSLSAPFSETVLVGNPAVVNTLVGNNQSATVATSLAQPLTVVVMDQYSNPVPNVPVTFNDGGAGGTISPVTITTSSKGTASTTYVAGTKSGAVTLTASVAGITPASFSLTINPGPASAINVTSGNNQTTMAGTAFAQPIVATVVDKYNNPVPGVQVNFSDGGADGVFSSPKVTADANGNVSTTYTASTKSGGVTLTASATGLTSATFNETVSPTAAAALVIIGGNSQTGPVANTLPQSLVVAARDGYGNAVPGVAVTFSDGLNPNTGGGSFPFGPTFITDSFGNATASYAAGTVAQSVTITASAPGVSSVTLPESINAGPAANLTIVSGNSQNPTPAGMTQASPLVVLVTDQYNNIVTGAQVIFDDSSSGGAFSGDPVTSDANGNASVFYTLPPGAASGSNITVNADLVSGTPLVMFAVPVQ